MKTVIRVAITLDDEKDADVIAQLEEAKADRKQAKFIADCLRRAHGLVVLDNEPEEENGLALEMESGLDFN